jgi:predicted metal-binding protein
MEDASAIELFDNLWERVAGDESSLDKSLSVECRKMRRVLFTLPPKIFKAILGGVSATAVEELRCYKAHNENNAHYQSCPSVIGIAAIIGVMGFLICGICALAGFVTAVIGLSAIVFVGSCVIKKMWLKRSMPTEEMKPSMTSYDIDVSESSVFNAVSEAEAGMKDALSLAKKLEEAKSEGDEFIHSRHFGEWLQKFADYCNDDASPSDLKILKNELFSKLRGEGIEVYDTIRKDKEGNIILPMEDSFRDIRPDAAIDFTEVRHAAVTSKDEVLAIGELA